MSQGQPDVIEPPEQTVLSKRLDLKFQRRAVRLLYNLTLQIDGQRVTDERRRFVEDAVHSGEMEGLPVAPASDEDATAYVNGTITLEEFGGRVRARNTRA